MGINARMMGKTCKIDAVANASQGASTDPEERRAWKDEMLNIKALEESMGASTTYISPF